MEKTFYRCDTCILLGNDRIGCAYQRVALLLVLLNEQEEKDEEIGGREKERSLILNGGNLLQLEVIRKSDSG